MNGIMFHLNEKLDIHDLIPIKQEFSLDDVVCLEAVAYRLNEKTLLCPILIEIQNKNCALWKDTHILWIDIDTLDQVQDYLKTKNKKGNAHCVKGVLSIKNIESLNVFLNTEYPSGRKYMFQCIEDQQRKVYWDNFLESLDLRDFKLRKMKFA